MDGRIVQVNSMSLMREENRCRTSSMSPMVHPRSPYLLCESSVRYASVCYDRAAEDTKNL